MINEYEYDFFVPFGDIGFVTCHGKDFCQNDLFEIIGKNQYMTTFLFKENSTTWNLYGESITGVIFYSPQERTSLAEKSSPSDSTHIKLLEYGSISRNSPEKLEELKYGGIKISDIKSITFTPYTQPSEFHECGKKRVPNIVELAVDTSLFDPDRLYQSYIVSKINSGNSLKQFEIEKFLGITLALNNGHIDSRILNHLGCTVDIVQKTNDIYYYWYSVLERKGKLDAHKKEWLSGFKLTNYLSRINKLFDEFKRGGIDTKSINEGEEYWNKINTLIIKFEPSILLHGKYEVWWDFDSYIHILLRHVEQWQVDKFKSKSAFLYKFEDIQRLIENVLKEIHNEITRHYEINLNKEFKRVGRMSVLFNNDYYNVQIDGNCRLVNFYMSASIV